LPLVCFANQSLFTKGKKAKKFAKSLGKAKELLFSAYLPSLKKPRKEKNLRSEFFKNIYKL